MLEICAKCLARSPGRTVFTVLLTLLLPLFLLASTNSAAQKVGDETCLTCHEDVMTTFANNVHMLAASEKGFVCESCHGPGSKHAEEGDPAFIYNPARDFSAAGENPCLTCHTGDRFDATFTTAHYDVGNGCSDCHVVHSRKTHLLKKQGSMLCMSCHQDVANKFNLTSHHPVKEGLLECQSCHEVHGGSAKHAFDDNSRQLCLSCHADKEGPFVYEHQPVNEDCQICHDPHGTVANNLLVENEPALCMSCHPMHFHTSIAGYVGDFTAPLNPTRGGTSTLDGMKASMLTKCTQCHTKVHGSDLPSQTISSQGKSLTR